MTVAFDITGMKAGFLATADEDALLEQLARTAHDLGFSQFALGHHVDLRGAQRDAIRLTNYHHGWIERALEERFYMDDPIHWASTRMGAGFLWSEVPGIIPLSERQRHILRVARDYGLSEGFTVPIHVPGEYRGTCSFGARSADDLTPNALPYAQLAGVWAFEAARRLMRAQRRRPDDMDPMPALTERQRDTLVLLARGKGDPEIAMVLGISARTAREHVDNIRKAYGYVQRTYLIARALFDGQIAFSEVFHW